MPRGQGCAGTPRLLDKRPSRTRRARLSPATPHGPSPGIHTEQSPSCPVCGSSGSPVGSPRGRLCPGSGSGRARAESWQRCPQHWRQLHAGCPFIYLELRHPSRDTASIPVCADPKTAQPAAKAACFSLQREPREPPDDKAVTHPLARQGRGNCWDTQDFQSSLNAVQSLRGFLPGLEGRAEGVEEKEFPWLCCVFMVSHGRY